jgi:hypothetical protein
MAKQDSDHVTPAAVVHFILDEMEAGICPTYYSNLVPSIYDVYLVSDDFERLRPLETRIREEAVQALGEKLSALNRAADPKLKLPFGVSRKQVKRYEILGDWSVELHENTEDDALESPLIIHSTFPVATDSEDRVGTLTERVSKRRIDGQTSTTSTLRTSDADTRRAAGAAYAFLAYEDETGAHTYQLTKDVIKIGRGSPDHWVDLKLKTKKDISREHLQIRRDSSNGQLFIKDLSTLGTTVDGERIPPSIQRTNGEEVDANIEVRLPSKARIGLADVLFIDFRAVKQR